LERFGIGAAHLVPKYGLDAPMPRTFERELFRMTFAGSDSRFGHGRAARKKMVIRKFQRRRLTQNVEMEMFSLPS